MKSLFPSSLAVLLAGLCGLSAHADAPYAVVLDQLYNPRGISFGPQGQLYVSQTGNGGTSGKITEIRDPWRTHPRQVRDIVTGLPSVPDGEGGFAGAAGVSVLGENRLEVIMQNIYTSPPPAPAPLGRLLRLRRTGGSEVIDEIADVADFDYAWWDAHPELGFPGDHPDANPYGVLALPGVTYIVDAATNTLERVHPDGKIEVLAYLPDNPLADATPTCVAQGPDGALYIGTLALVDSLTNGPSAIVYRVDPTMADPKDFHIVLTLAKPWATGLWPINGCTFGADGSFYASYLTTNPNFTGGDVVRIPFDHPQTVTSLTDQSLTTPAGVAVGPDGNVYVANGTAFVESGQVLRLARH